MVTKHTTASATSRPAPPEVAIQDFKRSLRGRLFVPQDPEYDTVRRIYNGMIDKHPRFIVRCAGVADVIMAVNFAREYHLPVAIRGGGHNVAGLATCDGGLVIELTTMKGIRVDPLKRLVRAEGGCTWGDLDHATHAFGLAAPGGIISTTGIAGLSLGGGIGHLTRQCGLSCDNLVSADVVTADGKFLTASATENEDLFWGLRGGGGNFGVVTSFEFKLHPVHTVVGGPVFYPIEKCRDVIKFFRDYIASAPEDMNAFFAFQIGPEAPFIPKHLQGVTMCAIVACYSGPSEKAESVVGPLRKFGPPALDLLGPLPFPVLQGLFDPLLPPGLLHYWKADYDSAITDEAIEVHAKYGPKTPTVQSTMHIYPTSGAVQKLKNDDTAYAYRDVPFVHVIPAMYTNPKDTDKNVAWVRDYWTALRPYSAGAAYVNFLGTDDGEDRVAATYRGNYKRLIALKQKYDPTNFFHVNQNIKPNV